MDDLPTFYCPDCELNDQEIELVPTGVQDTQWYGKLAYYTCPNCGLHYVSQDGGEPEPVAE